MNKTISKYQMGFIGIRARRVGRSSRLLINKVGAMRLTLRHGDLNNRNEWTHLIPVKTKAAFDAFDWRDLANAGLDGIAIWFSDAQWECNAGISDAQWRDRRIIEAQFNSQWPNGKRP